MTEVIILTGVYYYFWRIGYTHGIEGYPEYLGAGKFILMGVYAALTAMIMCFTGALRYSGLRVSNILIRQCGVMIAVNIITFMQLSLTAKHLVAKRPMFDAMVVQILFMFLYTIGVSFLIKHYSIAGKMLVLGGGDEGTEMLEIGKSLDGYRIHGIDTEKHTIVDISGIQEKADEYDAVFIQNKDETTNYIIEYCLKKKKAIYIAEEDPLIYGVKRSSDKGFGYVMVLGMESNERKFFDRVRAYLA